VSATAAAIEKSHILVLVDKIYFTSLNTCLVAYQMAKFVALDQGNTHLIFEVQNNGVLKTNSSKF
jgi:hypothetical protein